MPAQLKHGVIGAPGGKRKNAGRKPDLFREKCRALANSPKFFKYADEVFAGDEVVPHATANGVVHTSATPNERTYLWDKLAEYGHGKKVEIGDATMANLFSLVSQARAARGLKP